MLTDNFDDPEIEILNFDWTMRKTIWDQDLKKKKKKKNKFHQILEWNHHFRTNIVLLSENKTELKHSKNKLFKLKTNDDNFTMQHRSSYGAYECHISQTICHDLTQH